MNYQETHDDDYVEIPKEEKDYIPFHFSTCQDYDDYLEQADLECLINDWLEPIGLGWIIAKSNVGKTNFAIDMGMHLASGLSWYGNKVKQGHVYFFALEGGQKGISKRIRAIRKAKPEIAEKAYSYFHPTREPFDLSTDYDKDRLIRQMKETNNKPSMIFYDTLSEVHNARENNIEEMKTIIRRLRQVSNELSCFVMVLHHFGKNAENGGRGASSQLASIDTELSLEPTNDGFSCRATKQRDLEKKYDPIYFKNQKIDLETKEGKKFSAPYIEEGKPSDPSHTPAYNRVMDIVREHKEMGVNCYNKNIEDMAQMSQPQVSAVLKKLKEKRKIKTEYDEQAKRTKILPTL